MGLRNRDIERTSPLAARAYRPSITLPPNDVNFYALAVASNTFGSLPYSYSLIGGTGYRAWGGANNIWVQASGAGGFTPSDSVTFEFTGLNERAEPVRELLTMVGNSAASQYTMGAELFSVLTGVRVVATAGAVGTEAFAIGIGSGTAFPTSDQTASGVPAILIQHPCPGMRAGNFVVGGENTGSFTLIQVARTAVVVDITQPAAQDILPIACADTHFEWMRERAIGVAYTARDDVTMAQVVVKKGPGKEFGN